MISKDYSKLSAVKQCELIGIHRSGIYYKPQEESKLNLELMRLIDEHYLEHPYKGAPQMHSWLKHDKGYKVNHKRIERLYYKVMCLQSLLPGKHTSKRNKKHKVYPYLLRDKKIEYRNQVWQTDISYIPMANGFMYLSAIIDVHTRYVVQWSVSNTMESEWVAECLQEAFDTHGRPEIVNTDQGVQYTSKVFTDTVLADKSTKLSMDGKGRATDNAFIERLWRSVKYEKIYINPPTDGVDLYNKLSAYFNYYNNHRRHSSIDNHRPKDLYIEQVKEAA
jgi:Transposase and inactivated derivatives